MKITPVQPPTDIKQATSNNTDARARAINAFMNPGQKQAAAPAPTQGQAQEHPVANANSIAPEEMAAVQAPSAAQTVDNNTSIEDTQEPSEAVEAAPAEAKAESKPAETTQDPALKRQFQELARQERILRAKADKQRLELQRQQDAIKAQEEALNAKAKLYEQGYISKDRLKNDPLSALAEAELSYDDLTQRIMTQQPTDPRVLDQIKRLESTIANLENKLSEADKQAQDRQASEYKAALKQIERDTQKLVEAEPETYEAIAKTNSISDVVELIERTYKEDGIILTVDEAAEMVENYLVEEGYSTISKIEKIKRRLNPPQAPAEQKKVEVVKEQIQAAEQKTQGTMKTLTNAAGSTRKLTARERALLAFKGELK